MTNEQVFVKERFLIVKARLENPNADIEPPIRMRLQREHRLLDRLRHEVPEGEVLATLTDWRVFLGSKLVAHKKATRAQQEAYDAWLRLPRHRKEEVRQPERPSLGTTVKDANGYSWVIDDRFLLMMDDLINRLQKWLAGGG
ncbi:MAG: hypothetical protein KC421_27030 [Anaerolineales bacterium]|nr:hypothetical protein [Anaerolineales bacterium]